MNFHSGAMRRHFYDATSIECDRSSPLLKPAIRFEILNEVSGIAGDYIFPNDMTASEFESSRFYRGAISSCFRNPRECGFKIEQIKKPDSTALSLLEKDWDDLRRINPVLDAVDINISDIFNTLHAVNGAACLLNISDICFYTDMLTKTGSWEVYANAFKNEKWNGLHSEVLVAAAEKSVRWVPSMETLEDMAASLCL